jgi:hypothetical protein
MGLYFGWARRLESEPGLAYTVRNGERMVDTQIPFAPSDGLDHAWRYFELHANQRIAVFNFFVVISGAGATAIGAVLMAGPQWGVLGIAVGALMIVLAYLFWRLDQRTAFLVKHAERSLAAAEQDLAEYARVVSKESAATELARRDPASHGFGMWSYSRVFRASFWLGALIGAAGAGLSLARLRFWTTWPQ